MDGKTAPDVWKQTSYRCFRFAVCDRTAALASVVPESKTMPLLPVLAVVAAPIEMQSRLTL